jgi:peptide/nickel transport system permease protein
MLRFIVRRLIQMAGVIIVLSMVMFFWLRSLPGGPVSAMLGERQTEARRAALEEALGLDEPLPVQYLKFVQRALEGDFGTSTKVLPGEDALDIFLDRLPATIELAFLALLIAVALGIPLGYFAAKRRGSAADTGTVIASLVGVAVPVFFTAFLLKYAFAVEWQLLPVSGRASTGVDATQVTGFFVLDGLLTREWDAAWDAFLHLILPAVALSTIPFAVIFRITRASVLDVMEEDYVRTAEAKGLDTRVIRRRHVLRNAMLPVVTITGLQVGALLSGAVLTETVFAFRGVGDALATAFRDRDYPVLQVIIMCSAVIYVVVNLIVDISYAILDPRVRTR